MHELKLRAGTWPLGTLAAVGWRGKWWLAIEIQLSEAKNLPLHAARFATLQELCRVLYQDDPADPLSVVPNGRAYRPRYLGLDWLILQT